MQATWVHSFELAYSDLERGERREIVTTSKGVTGRCVVDEFGQHVPLAWRESAKISKLLLADLSCNTLKKDYEISVFQHKLLTYKNRNL